MKKSYLLLHIAVLLAGFTGVFGKVITLPEIPLVWYRMLISIIVLFLVTKIANITPLSSKKEIFHLGKVGVLLTIHWILFYASIKYSNISIGVICYCLTSFFTAIFEPLLNRKRFDIIQLLLSTLTIAGISMIFHFDSSFQVGIGLGVASSAFAALYTIYNERLVKKYDSRLLLKHQLIGGFIFLTPLFILYHLAYPAQNLLPSSNDLISLFLLATLCTVLLYTLFAEVLKMLNAFTVNLTFNLEPIYAILIAFIFFQEGKEVNFFFYVGLVLVILSVMLQSNISLKKT